MSIDCHGIQAPVANEHCDKQWRVTHGYEIITGIMKYIVRMVFTSMGDEHKFKNYFPW